LERELYNLEDDPLEQHNEAFRSPGLADSLAGGTRVAFANCLEPTAHPFGTSLVPPLPQDLQRQLKAVGYLEE
jgi:hypothetical protein